MKHDLRNDRQAYFADELAKLREERRVMFGKPGMIDRHHNSGLLAALVIYVVGILGLFAAYWVARGYF